MTSADAAEIAISGMPKESIPAAFGGELHGENTSTVEVNGQGTLTATINYDTGIVTVKDFNDAVRTESRHRCVGGFWFYVLLDVGFKSLLNKFFIHLRG